MKWILDRFLAHPAWSGIAGIAALLALIVSLNPGLLPSFEESSDDTGVEYNVASFDGRVGKIHVKNTSLYEFKVTLWHPDSESIFGDWAIEGVSKRYLRHNGQVFNIGNDWGVQIGESDVKSIGKAAKWINNEWRLSQDSFFAD